MADIVISTRMRLARNLLGYPFLSRATQSQRREVLRTIADAVSASALGREFTFIDVESATELDRLVLVERHLISRQHAGGEGSRGVVVSEKENIALMINEEDHLRIQALRSGMRLQEVFDDVNRVDDALDQRIEFAFHERFGYLTACPTNVGTGLRVSVMLHLPALKMTDQLPRVLRATKDMHVAVRGLFGEGTEAMGDFYQISNQTTLGKSEDEIIRDFEKEVIPSIVEYEKQARRLLVKEKAALLDDKVWRALGLLEHARTMSTEETLNLLSHMRMGVNLGRIPDIKMSLINELFLLMQPGHLQKISGENLNGEQRSVFRAEYIRNRLSGRN